MNMNLTMTTNSVPDGASSRTFAVQLSIRGHGFYLADAANAEEASEAREELNRIIRQLQGEVDLDLDELVVKVEPPEEVSTRKSD
jgi:hypothetical protein